MKITKSKKALTLTEIIVASALAATVIAGLFGAFTFGRRLLIRHQLSLEAVSLCSEVIDHLLEVADKNLDDTRLDARPKDNPRFDNYNIPEGSLLSQPKYNASLRYCVTEITDWDDNVPADTQVEARLITVILTWEMDGMGLVQRLDTAIPPPPED